MFLTTLLPRKNHFYSTKNVRKKCLFLDSCMYIKNSLYIIIQLFANRYSRIFFSKIFCDTNWQFFIPSVKMFNPGDFWSKLKMLCISSYIYRRQSDIFQPGNLFGIPSVLLSETAQQYLYWQHTTWNSYNVGYTDRHSF